MVQFSLLRVVKGTRVRLLVTSIGDKVPLLKVARDALDRFGGGVLVGQDRDKTVIGRMFVDEFHQGVPQDCDLVIPTRDDELSWIGSYGGVVCKNVGRFTDKLRFADLCIGLGIRHPMTRKSPDELDLPYVSKARHGAGSRDFRIMLTKRFTITKEEPEQIYQERVTGTEYSCDAYYTQAGTLRGFVVRSRDRIKNGEAVVTTVTHEIDELCADYLSRFDGMRGPINMQLIGETVIEVNPRVGGAMTCSIAAGLDVIYWLLLEHAEHALPPFTIRDVRQTRIAADIVEEI